MKMTKPRGNKRAAEAKNIKYERMKSGCPARTQDGLGGGSDRLSVLEGALLFILYSICVMLQLGACFKGGRLNWGEMKGPSREYEVTKDLLHPCPETIFLSRNNRTSEKRNRHSRIDRSRL